MENPNFFMGKLTINAHFPVRKRLVYQAGYSILIRRVSRNFSHDFLMHHPEDPQAQTLSGSKGNQHHGAEVNFTIRCGGFIWDFIGFIWDLNGI